MDKWLAKPNVVKVIALFLGILLWFVVHLDVKTSTETSGGTSVRNEKINNVSVSALDNYDSSKYSIVSIDPPEVTVILNGRDASVKRINTSNFKIVVDLSEQQPGTLYLPVKTDRPLPAGVTAEILPERVKVVLEERQRKEVPVTINVTGTPAEGYKAGQPVVNPKRVHVTVSSSMLDIVDSARAEVNVDKASSAVTKQVRLSAYDKNGKVVEGAISPQVVDVEVPVTVPFKTMPLQIKWIGSPAKGFAVSGVQQSVDQVTVYGPQQVLDKMDFYEGFQLDISGIKENKSWALDLPLKNKVAQVDPGKLEIKLNVVPSAVKTLEGVPITVIGLNEGLTTKWISSEAGTLSVTVEGAPAIIDKLKLQDVQAIVDVSNLPQGKHEVPVTISLPAFVKRVDEVTKVTIEIGSKQTANSTPVQPTATPTPSLLSPLPTPTMLPSSSPTVEPSVQAAPTSQGRD